MVTIEIALRHHRVEIFYAVFLMIHRHAFIDDYDICTSILNAYHFCHVAVVTHQQATVRTLPIPEFSFSFRHLGRDADHLSAGEKPSAIVTSNRFVSKKFSGYPK